MNNQQNDDMDRQTLNVAFATQKGGSSKTAITVLVAGYLHYRLGCPLAVIDCDFPQYTILYLGFLQADRGNTHRLLSILLLLHLHTLCLDSL